MLKEIQLLKINRIRIIILAVNNIILLLKLLLKYDSVK